MRVLLLGPYPPPHGGVQSNLVAIRNFLRRQNIPCSVINITRHRRQNEDEVYYPESPAALLRLLYRLDYDIVHLHIGGLLTRRLLALCLVCNLMTRKSVLTFHSGGFPSTPEGKATGPNSLAAFALRRFDGLIGVNSEIVGFLHRLGIASEKVRLIYPHSFAPQAPAGSSLPEPLASFFATHDPVLISVGLLEPEYDLPLQIQALGLVRQRRPSAGLVLIGSGSLEQEIRASIQQQPWAEHILLCGDVPHNCTLQAIAKARIMLRTTLYDGDSVSVREALHAGTPVIASDNGMRPQGVHLIPKSDALALLRAIDLELAAPRPRQEPSGPDQTNLQAVLDFYRELLSSDPRQVSGHQQSSKRRISF